MMSNLEKQWQSALRSPSPTRASIGSPKSVISAPTPKIAESPKRAFFSLQDEVEVAAVRRAYDQSLQSLQGLLRGENTARRRIQEEHQVLLERLEHTTVLLNDERQRNHALQLQLLSAREEAAAAGSMLQGQITGLQDQLARKQPKRLGILANSQMRDSPLQVPHDDYIEVVVERSEYEDLLRQLQDATGSWRLEEAANSKLQSISEERERAHESQIQLMTSEVDRLITRERMMAKENAELRTTIEALTEENHLLQSSCAAATNTAADRERDIRSMREQHASNIGMIETLRRELQQTQTIAHRKVQELSAEVANQRSTASHLKEALSTANSTLEAEAAIHHLHDVQVLRSKVERMERDALDKEKETNARLADKDQLIRTLRASLGRSNEEHQMNQNKIEQLSRLNERLQTQIAQ